MRYVITPLCDAINAAEFGSETDARTYLQGLIPSVAGSPGWSFAENKVVVLIWQNADHYRAAHAASARTTAWQSATMGEVTQLPEGVYPLGYIEMLPSNLAETMALSAFHFDYHLWVPPDQIEVVEGMLAEHLRARGQAGGKLPS